MRTSSVTGLALLSLFIACGLSAGEGPPAPGTTCRLIPLASLDLDVNPNGAIGVPVTLNETEAWMVLSTSSAGSVISDEAVAALGLKRERVSNSTRISVNGKSLTERVVLKSLGLGSVRYENAQLAVDPVKRSELPTVMGRPVVGSLGINAFATVDFELDIAGKKLNLFSRDHCPGSVVYWTQEYTEMPFTWDEIGTIVFPMELDGRKIEATLAATVLVSMIDSHITRNVYGFDEDSPEVSRESTEGGSTVSRFKAMALSAPGLNVANTKVQLMKGDRNCGQTSRRIAKVRAVGYAYCRGVTPLILGRNVLSRLRIYVATGEKVIYVSRADAT